MSTKKRKHIITDKVPWLVALILMILGIAVPNAVSGVVAGFFGGTEVTAGRICNTVTAMLVSFIMMGLYTLWFRPEFEGNLGSDGIAKGFRLAVPFFVAWAVYFVLNKFVEGAEYDFAGIMVWLSGFAAGVTEEVAFRGLATTTLLRKYRSEKIVWLPGVLIGVLFGAVHMMNLTAGDDLIIVLLTTVFAIGGGLVFGAIYTMCGNLWPVIFAHGLYDSISFSILENPNEPIEIGLFTYLQIGIMFAVGILALITLIRKRRSASDLWHRKWNTIA